MAALVACSAAICAANGVDFRDPLKPALPPVDQASTLPCWSVKVMIVLLKVALMWACACITFLRSRLRARCLFCAIGQLLGLSPCVSACGYHRRRAWGPCGSGRWCGCADHGPADPDGA